MVGQVTTVTRPDGSTYTIADPSIQQGRRIVTRLRLADGSTRRIVIVKCGDEWEPDMPSLCVPFLRRVKFHRPSMLRLIAEDKRIEALYPSQSLVEDVMIVCQVTRDVAVRIIRQVKKGK